MVKRGGRRTPRPEVRLGRLLNARQLRAATVESCTGGLIAKRITDVPGSSAWFDRGLVTYSNDAKQDLLGVSTAILKQHGAVSRECALAMAEGLLARSPAADLGVAVTGIAGPGGGTPGKPVGLVWLAWAVRGGEVSAKKLLASGSRAAIRTQAADAALAGLIARAAKVPRRS